MKKLLGILIVTLLIVTISCKKDKKETEISDDAQIESVTDGDQNTEATSEPEGKKLAIRLESKSGSTASGNVIIKERNGVVNMVAVVGGLSEGVHAIHLHEKADCSSEDGTSTGGHWNPTAQPHGKWGAAEGFHKGDIGNFTADANGNGTITFITSEWCVGCGDPAKDILGKAIIVHQGEDDFKTQPTGAAGGRISCGGIIE